MLKIPLPETVNLDDSEATCMIKAEHFDCSKVNCLNFGYEVHVNEDRDFMQTIIKLCTVLKRVSVETQMDLSEALDLLNALQPCHILESFKMTASDDQ